MGSTQEQAVSSPVTISSIGSKERNRWPVSKQKSTCSVSTQCPTTLLWRRRHWSTLGPLLSPSLEVRLASSSGSPLCPCGMVSMSYRKPCKGFKNKDLWNSTALPRSRYKNTSLEQSQNFDIFFKSEQQYLLWGSGYIGFCSCIQMYRDFFK